MNPIEEIVNIASSNLGETISSVETLELCMESKIDNAYEMYRRRNGFFAFESALHLLPLDEPCTGYSLRTWNSPSMWRYKYDNVVHIENTVFFAEDVFGEQFGIYQNMITRFNPETGSMEYFADDVIHWADKILKNFNYEVGYKIAHDWQKINGALDPKQRLVPKTPFFLGGEYSITNLYAIDSLQGMLLRASVYEQTKNLPDGTRIRLKVE